MIDEGVDKLGKSKAQKVLDKVPDQKLLEVERNRRIKASQKLLEGEVKNEWSKDNKLRESEKPKGNSKWWFEPADWIKNFRIPTLSDVKSTLKTSISGVPSMAAISGILGAAESDNPLHWGASAGFGGAAQYAFNIASKTPVISSFIGPLAGALIPGFSQKIADAVTGGGGPLSPARYIEGLKDNEFANSAVEMVSRLGLSSLASGLVFTRKDLMADELYTELQRINSPSSLAGVAHPSDLHNQQMVEKLTSIDEKLKQPTINQISVEMSNSDPYALFQQFVQWLGTTGNTQGLQLSLIHISETTRLMSSSYAVFCLKKKMTPLVILLNDHTMSDAVYSGVNTDKTYSVYMVLETDQPITS